jgi:hypothetical protein
MRNRSTLLVLGLVLLGSVGAACGNGSTAGSPPPTSETLRVGDPAPAFSLPSAQGGSVSLAEFRDDMPVLLYFSMGPGVSWLHAAGS